MPFASSAMLVVMGTQLGAQLVGPGWMLLGDLYLKKKWREEPWGSEGLFACILLRMNTNAERNECVASTEALAQEHSEPGSYNVTKRLSLESRGQRVKAMNTCKTEIPKERILKGEIG